MHWIKDFKKTQTFLVKQNSPFIPVISFLYPAASRRTNQYSVFPYGVQFPSRLAYIPNTMCYE